MIDNKCLTTGCSRRCSATLHNAAEPGRWASPTIDATTRSLERKNGTDRCSYSRRYVALNPETGMTTQGETVEEAIANLTEATALFLSEFPLPASGHPLVTMFSVPAHA